jgi:Electron transfer DM13
MRLAHPTLAIVVLAAWAASPALADLTSPQVGWQANLSDNEEDVSGTVTIVDDNTIQVDNFTYAGGGISVYFYLGTSESTSAFSSGLKIGDQLVGTVFDGTQAPLVIDLPTGNTLEGYNAISVWCEVAHVNFGSGTFAAVSTPLFGDYNDDGVVDAADYTEWRDAVDAGSSSLANDPTSGTVDETDFTYWRDHFGESSGSGAAAAGSQSASPVPEPATLILATLAAGLVPFSLWER